MTIPNDSVVLKPLELLSKNLELLETWARDDLVCSEGPRRPGTRI